MTSTVTSGPQPRFRWLYYLPIAHVARMDESARPGARLGRLRAVGCTCCLLACSCQVSCLTDGGGVLYYTVLYRTIPYNNRRSQVSWVESCFGRFSCLHVPRTLCFTQRCVVLLPTVYLSHSRLTMGKASDVKGWRSLPDLHMRHGITRSIILGSIIRSLLSLVCR